MSSCVVVSLYRSRSIFHRQGYNYLLHTTVPRNYVCQLSCSADVELFVLVAHHFLMAELLQDKLREKEREARKRKEREEQELERVRVKARRKDAATAYQALLTEKIKDAEVNSCGWLF